MNEATYKVEGMSCQHCVMSVKKALAALPLKSAKVEIGSVDVSYDPDLVQPEKIVDAISQAGYQVVE